MKERAEVEDEPLPEELPRKVAELLARPRLTELPDHPVGSVWAKAKAYFTDYHEIQLPEMLDKAEAARAFGSVNLQGSGADCAFQVDDERVLRTELTGPLCPIGLPG